MVSMVTRVTEELEERHMFHVQQSLRGIKRNPTSSVIFYTFASSFSLQNTDRVAMSIKYKLALTFYVFRHCTWPQEIQAGLCTKQELKETEF